MAFGFTCPDCGNAVAFYSRRRGFTEKFLLPLLLLRPYRCADCFNRSYRSVFLRARRPRSRKDEISPSDPATRARRIA
jgi:hypothetical protein